MSDPCNLHRLTFCPPSVHRRQHGVLRQRAETSLPPVLLLSQWDGLNDSRTFLWSHRRPSPRLSVPSDVWGRCLVPPGVNLQSPCLCFTGKDGKKTHMELQLSFVAAELNTILHFLVVMLYTERASVHHDQWGNAAMLCTNQANANVSERAVLSRRYRIEDESTISNRK